MTDTQRKKTDAENNPMAKLLGTLLRPPKTRRSLREPIVDASPDQETEVEQEKTSQPDPILRTQQAPVPEAQRTQQVPAQRTQQAPIQEAQQVPVQRTQQAPIHRTQQAPVPEAQQMPAQRIEQMLLRKAQQAAGPRSQEAPDPRKPQHAQHHGEGHHAEHGEAHGAHAENCFKDFQERMLLIYAVVVEFVTENYRWLALIIVLVIIISMCQSIRKLYFAVNMIGCDWSGEPQEEETDTTAKSKKKKKKLAKKPNLSFSTSANDGCVAYVRSSKPDTAEVGTKVGGKKKMVNIKKDLFDFSRTYL